MFQSTPPARAATQEQGPNRALYVVSIHAAREGGDAWRPGVSEHHVEVSIHAAREGGDAQEKAQFKSEGVSIHAAREGGDALPGNPIDLLLEFQSTPPARAAT